MKQIHSSIKNFYRYYSMYAEFNANSNLNYTIYNKPCSRGKFILAALEATNFLVQNIAKTIFYSLAVTATLGLKPNFRKAFCKNSYEGFIHGITIPLSVVGIIFPAAINNNILKNTKPFNTLVPITENNAVIRDLVSALGTMRMHYRTPL